jgi:secernin
MEERRSPKGCDTFIAYPPTTANGYVLFGKNSDRPAGEGQSIRRYPASTPQNDEAESTVTCTYLSIPQASHTHAVLVSQIDWMWGCEHGANEHGVVIGNEAVWTRVPDEEGGDHHLLGMDLVRLGLERGSTSREALNVMTRLLTEHGQGGPCAQGDPSFTYHNSFLIADFHEAFLLETAGRHWVAKRFSEGAQNISNGLTIRTDFDLSSEGIQEYAKTSGLWNGDEPFDFAMIFSQDGVVDDESTSSRQGCGRCMLAKHSNSGAFSRHDMMTILRDHESGICMHGGFETTASMMSELYPNKKAKHWTTGPHPCKSTFSLQEIIAEQEIE